MKLLLVASVLLCSVGACETPPLTVRFRLTDGDSQQCIGDTGNETTSCSDITLECEAVFSIRIVPPNEPEVPYASTCQALPRSAQSKLCSIAGVDIPQPLTPIPEQVLEVQLAVFPRSAVTEVDGKLQCPIVQFGVDGLPVTQTCSSASDSAECMGRPAVGGRAFYYPGDEETVVDLGCTELELLRGCKGTSTEVIAAVTEFDYGGLDPTTANHLFVAIGEPQPGSMMNYVLDSSRTYPLPRDPAALSPTWSAELPNVSFAASYCIEVLEDAPMATRTLTCRVPEPPNQARIDAVGTRLKPETLATILKAAGLTTFPSRGLVVGIVLDPQFIPVPGAVVTAPCEGAMPKCTIKYLSADKLSFSTTGGTSSNGIWISEDAPYGTVFSRQFPSVASGFGGVVDNKVTTVVLQEPGVGM